MSAQMLWKNIFDLCIVVGVDIVAYSSGIARPILIDFGQLYFKVPTALKMAQFLYLSVVNHLVFGPCNLYAL